jgi:hypothetical protein
MRCELERARGLEVAVVAEVCRPEVVDWHVDINVAQRAASRLTRPLRRSTNGHSSLAWTNGTQPSVVSAVRAARLRSWPVHRVRMPRSRLIAEIERMLRR